MKVLTEMCPFWRLSGRVVGKNWETVTLRWVRGWEEVVENFWKREFFSHTQYTS